MAQKEWQVYLSGEIHSDWRSQIQDAAVKAELQIRFFAPVTDHSASDECGVNILGDEEKKFWRDRKGASINAIRNQTLKILMPPLMLSPRLLIR